MLTYAGPEGYLASLSNAPRKKWRAPSGYVPASASGRGKQSQSLYSPPTAAAVAAAPLSVSAFEPAAMVARFASTKVQILTQLPVRKYTY